ncbi:MAG: excinuclease ABC subunit UvrA [Planctomycetota bacterium]|nr:excinuclease ABC subunit UvrA [Planctomycetota bacterium]
MPASDIVIKGAREHNLQDVSLVLPRNQLICLTGVSGSGKSSLAFDTLYAEGQRRYIESLSSFARQFLGQMPKPDVDLISGLSPSISISQKSAGNNPRSTVGTITEIYDYLRVLFARVGTGHCPRCAEPITAQSRDEIIGRILAFDKNTRFQLLAPVVRAQKGSHQDLFEDLLKQGFVRARVDGEIVSLNDNLNLDRQQRHNVEVVVDRLVNKGNIRGRLAEAVDQALKIGKGNLIAVIDEPSATPDDSTGTPQIETRDIPFSADYACVKCGISFDPPSPQMFSFNSPQGMCLTCDGLGDLYSFDPELLVACPEKSFKKGAIPLIGTWKDIGRWKRHIYTGVADTVERTRDLEEGTLLETPWEDLPEELQQTWLYGTGDQHITFTWRGGSSPMKYGGTFSGIIPDLMSKYQELKSKPLMRKYEESMSNILCPDCLGGRLCEQARSVRIRSAEETFADRPALTLPELCGLPISEAADFFSQIDLDSTRALIASEALKEIRSRLGFLMNVGLDYLTLDRSAPTLSGGEAQRIRLAGQIGSGLVGVLYILDEPSIGLHARDNDRLISTLVRLRDMGNTVVVVEHDEDTMWAADHIIDFGPGPGVRGGEVVVEGPPAAVVREKRSLTGQYLSRSMTVPRPDEFRKAKQGQFLRVRGARHNNLKNVTAEIPLGCFVCITGVSGSGKSSLVNGILVEALRRDLNHGLGEPGEHDEISGLDHLDKLIAIDQSPIGRTPRSNPGTYIKVFDEIRSLFTQLPDSKKRGFKPGRFSFNVKGGRCEACEGNGANKLEMDFLADIWVTCPVCQGQRFNHETLQVKFKDYSIADVLNMEVGKAIELFENIPKIHSKLMTLKNVGLDYLKIGQPSPTLSGGEAQRIKLARELVKKSTGQTLYLLDEPTTGLHFADIRMLLNVLQQFAEAGNTVLVVEHNLDVIQTADWIIDIGPEGGSGGGNIVAAGPPEEIARCRESHTGQALKKYLEQKDNPPSASNSPVKKRKRKTVEQAKSITVQGATQHNLRTVDAKIDRDRMTVFCGPSGSGKSSLAMDTIYAEGQRRYVESLSSYARQFVNQMQKPKLENVEGLSPAIAIEQKNLGSTPRSTVGTVTEIYDYLRILMSRLGTSYCPDCDSRIGTQTVDQVIAKVLQSPEGTRAYLLAPVSLDSNTDIENLFADFQANGYARVRVDGSTYAVETPPSIDRRRKHEIELVVDRVTLSKKSASRIAESIEAALAIGKGVMHVAFHDEEIPEERWKVIRHSQHLACENCGRSFERLSPHNFSFNSQLGWCDACEGLGMQTGANPAALINDPTLSLSQGAISLWPGVENGLGQKMIEAFGRETRFPIDKPIEELTTRERRLLLHGTGEQWFEVRKSPKSKQSIFRFQYKGLYPALEEAARTSFSFRRKLESFVDEVECTNCDGSRLRDDAGAMQFRGLTMGDICRLPLGKLVDSVKSWKLNQREKKIAGEVLREIRNRLDFLLDVGLAYLTLSRTAASLSNGEAQRIRLASQLGSGLCGVLYVLDEPTIGLHPRDNTRLLKALHRLRDLGNTLLVVEHDKEVIESADTLFDFGPKAGVNGGQIVANGSLEQLVKKRASVTGPYLSEKKSIPIPQTRRPGLKPYSAKKEVLERVLARSLSGKKPKKKTARKKKRAFSGAVANSLDVIGARHNNLKNVNLSIPLETVTVITGPSGCGKSSIVNDILFNALSRRLHRSTATVGNHDALRGVQNINKVIRVDQAPLGNTPTSNPATYTGVFELIRTLFSQLPESKVRGFSPRRFSFNVPGGRCEECAGNGQICIEMHFLPDVWVECETCSGKRYNEETLAVRYHGYSINDVLEMSCGEALKLFRNIPKIRRIVQTLCDVGLDYVRLGQSAPTLSGGEAQRVKLAAELARPDTGRTLYLLDEPTTGLHFTDLEKLMEVLHRLVDIGNTVVLIEHNLDVIKNADWVIDMGPEAGQEGGHVVATGTPEQIVAHAAKAKKSNSGLLRSYTGEALKPALQKDHYKERKIYDPYEAEKERKGDVDIEDVGKDIAMPWERNGRAWHTSECVDRNGSPVKWDGRIVDQVVDKIQDLGQFADTNWNSRNVVEITGAKKSLGWFFHALTGESWMLKMKFRVRRNTFKKEELQTRIPLLTLNQLDDIPLYGNDSRVKCKNLAGPWQEVEIRAHSLEELNRTEFWNFVEDAVKGFEFHTEKSEENIENHMPWKKLGRVWHYSGKGYSPGKRRLWDPSILEKIEAMINEVGGEVEWVWDNKVLAHFNLPGSGSNWGTINTKKENNLPLFLYHPKDSFSYGEVTEFGSSSELVSKSDEQDYIRIDFDSVEQVASKALQEFIKRHFETVAGETRV